MFIVFCPSRGSAADACFNSPTAAGKAKSPRLLSWAFPEIAKFLSSFLRLRIPGMTHSQGSTHATTSAHAATRLDAVSFQKHKFLLHITKLNGKIK